MEFKTYAAHESGKVFAETWTVTLVEDKRTLAFPDRVREHPVLGLVLFESAVHVRVLPKPTRFESVEDGEYVVGFHADDSAFYELWNANYLDGWSEASEELYKSYLKDDLL